MGDEERRLVSEVIDSNYLNDGEITRSFENRIAELLGCRHVVAVTSGTAAIFLALAGVGVGPGDEVIVPDITFIATLNAVVLTGAKPVPVDVSPATLNIDPEAAKRAVTRRTKAIIPVHVSGRAADMARIMDFAEQQGLVVIEDAAEALASRHEGKSLGTIGKAGCLSFSPNKTITSGQGGAVLTDDDALHVRLRELKDQGRPTQGTGGDDIHPAVGYNFKLTNLQAAVGLAQSTRLQARLKRLKEIYLKYEDGLAGVEGVSLVGFQVEKGESPQWVDALAERRDELVDYLAAHGIHCRKFWFPNHHQIPYRRPDDDFPNSTRLVPKAFWLPSAFTLSDEDVDAVCVRIKDFFKQS